MNREPADHGAQLPVLDEHRFVRLFHDNQALLTRISRTFFESTAQTLAALEAALAAGDRKLAGQHAHRLKGALANMAAPRAAKSAQRLESVLCDALEYGFAERGAAEDASIEEVLNQLFSFLLQDYSAYAAALRTRLAQSDQASAE